MKSKCPRCSRYEHLTKHHINGGHRGPYIRICRLCHDKLEGMLNNKKGEKCHAKRLGKAR